jgi:TonB family protein
MKTKSALTKAFVAALLAFTMGLCQWRAAGQEVRKLVASPAPEYPLVARRLSLQGSVKIEVTVGPDGEIKDTKVIGGHPVFVESALKALRDWKYERASTETRVQIEFKFHP